MANTPEVWEARGPLLAFILQSLEDASPSASPLVQLFVDLLEHLLHLTRCRLVELLRDREWGERDVETQEERGASQSWVLTHQLRLSFRGQIILFREPERKHGNERERDEGKEVQLGPRENSSENNKLNKSLTPGKV